MCDICQKMYQKKAALKIHWNVVHNSKKMVCNICNKMYKGKTALRDHQKRIHKEFQFTNTNLFGQIDIPSSS